MSVSGRSTQPSASSGSPITSNPYHGIPCFKLILIGDASVGKTLFVRRLFGLEFSDSYHQTKGAEVLTKVFYTSSGPIGLTIWDTAGDDQYRGQGEGYYIQASCAILMFDFTNKKSYGKLEAYYQSIIRILYPANIPIVVCGNKHDCKANLHEIKENDVRFPDRHQLSYFPISVKTNYNTFKPIVYLLRKITGDPHLQVSVDSSHRFTLSP